MFETLSTHRSFGGHQRLCRHDSAEIGLPMRFALFVPPEPRALLVFLAGLTCTEETFTMKAGAQRVAAELGLALLMPDTSPRGAQVPGEAAAWDFGVGAGFYLDATQPPWAQHWRMESYITQELLPLVRADLQLPADRVGISGHSMGGHGALTLALRHPQLFRSVSAFAPIAAPSRCAWGQKAFTGYLGRMQTDWAAHDASALMAQQARAPFPQGILIDQGLADQFLLDMQLQPEVFEAACKQAGQPLNLRWQAGYDHGYYFITSFIEDHLRHHAAQLTHE
ncbi:S-formylglutathione hydrolase [Roseateles koreensis]|uniref:S-formylglutathione hydrolase n=1 Tax=Roseateles koreensis TaxID=2987526 RepID=A0ABT5KRD9_9BURK|nr:S-formylglutathione hydrolase [Roseateles koreensis]MDC8784943.1 S-formylglutathione hydrolase [Roseateles koreensis]